MGRRTLRYMGLDELREADRNPKKHDLDELRRSMDRFGFTIPMMIDERTGQLVAGHGRLQLLTQMRDAGEEEPEGIEATKAAWKAPVIRGWSSKDDAEAQAYLIADNLHPTRGGWDMEQLAEMVGELRLGPNGLEGIGLSEQLAAQLLGSEGDGGGGGDAAPRPTLADRFLVPPFTVLDARQGYWQERRRQWQALGIRSEEGRPTNLLKMSDTVLVAQGKKRAQANLGTPRNESGSDPSFFAKKQRAERQLGRELTTAEFLASGLYVDGTLGGTSIFDPTLCEVAYRWWCPPGGAVLDPFAGGSVRGVVASLLGRPYCGVDLRPEQVAANREQAEAICRDPQPAWHLGDAADVCAEWPEEGAAFDFLFTCPPYFDLELYSEDPKDLSNAPSYDAFLAMYRRAIANAVGRLAEHRFACVVVGDIRDERGAYRGFVPDTVRAFDAAGCSFYNEAILVTPVGSLAIRAARIFAGGRKLAKAHQNVLVFCKGDPKRANEACGEVEVVDPAELFGDVVLDEATEPAAADA